MKKIKIFTKKEKNLKVNNKKKVISENLKIGFFKMLNNCLIIFEIESIENKYIKFKYELIEKSIFINQNKEKIVSKLIKSIKKWISFICLKK